MPTSPTPKMNRKALMAAMNREREEVMSRVKTIQFPLPDLRGPGGNAYALMGQAESLMRKSKVSEAARSKFQTEAMSGDYQHLLKTLRRWFTVVVAQTTYVELDDAEYGAYIDSVTGGEESDEDMETSMLAAREQYTSFEDSKDPEVLDLRGLTPIEAVKKMAEHSAKKAAEGEKDNG